MLLGPNTKVFGPAEFQNMDCTDLSQVNGAKEFLWERDTGTDLCASLCIQSWESQNLMISRALRGYENKSNLGRKWAQILNLEFPELPLKSAFWFTMKMYQAINIHDYINLINSGSIVNMSSDVFVGIVTFGHSKSSISRMAESTIHLYEFGGTD